MEIACPACRKRSTDVEQCSRCEADLRSLRQIIGAAERALSLGSAHLRRGDGRRALEAARKAWRLKHSSAAARLAFLACLHQRRFAAASTWYVRAVGLRNPN